MKTFEHGGNIEEFAKELSCKVEDIIDLSSNINFIKPEIKLDFNTLDISAYPSYENLYKAIAKNYKIKSENLELFNGGSSAIFTLFRFLDLKYCTIYSPAYLEYKKAALTYAYDLRLINRFENMNLPVKENSLVIFVNPSTPDGTLYDIEKMLDYWMEKHCTVLIDESFLDFCEGKSALEFIEKYENLYILKSMTKFYSSAGIRVGAIVSNKNNIEKLQRFEPMWKLSTFDSHYLQEALKDFSFKKISKSINIKNRIVLENILKNSPLVEAVYESKANYILVKLKNISASQLQEKLKKYKIMIRDCSNFDFLDSSYVRIAVKSNEANVKLKEALESLC